METVTIASIPILVGREEDRRWWADIESMPGVMAYGATREAARGGRLYRARRISYRAVCPGLLRGVSHWRAVKAKQLLAACIAPNRMGGSMAARLLSQIEERRLAELYVGVS
jgi:hypothetical protein